jgi:hypothetical protein
MQAYLLNRITSPLRRPDPLNLFHQPLRNSSIDLRRFLLSHPMRSIDLRLFEVLAQAAHIRGQFRVLRCGAHGVVGGVDLSDLVSVAAHQL